MITLIPLIKPVNQMWHKHRDSRWWKCSYS